MLGFVLGIARLSSNWLVSRLATIYIETIRNIPLLLQLFFWYFAVPTRPVCPPANSQ
jgi:general L-amino acid transport system permease protein